MVALAMVSAGLGLLPLSHVHGVTLIDGGEVDGRWTKTGSPYLVKGKVIVPYGKRLVVEPGVLVGFYPVQPHAEQDVRVRGTGRLSVEGSIHAVGTEAEPIVFTSSRDPLFKDQIEPDAKSSALPWGWIEVLGVPRKHVRGHVHYDAQWLTEEEQMAYHFASIGEGGQVAKNRPLDYGLDEEEGKRIRKLAEDLGYTGHGGHGQAASAEGDSSAAGPPPPATDSSSVMEHCTIRHSGYHWSLNVYTTMQIRNCSFSENISSPIGVFWGRPHILDSRIEMNHSHGMMILQGGAAVIERNRIINNAGIGIDVHFAPQTVIRENVIAGHSTAINDPSGTTVIERNILAHNAEGVATSRAFYFVDARDNYWGDPSGPLDKQDDRAKGGEYNPEGKGNEVRGQVLYKPFLTTPPFEADLPGAP
jgi:hypothetical protein